MYLTLHLSCFFINDKEVFEIRENVWLGISSDRTGLDSNNFNEDVEESFCSSFVDSKMKDFLLDSLIHQGRKDAGEGIRTLEQQKEFCKSIYNFEIDSVKEVVSVTRSDVGKFRRLEAIKKDKINFVVDFEWDLAEEFEVSFDEINRIGGK